MPCRMLTCKSPPARLQPARSASLAPRQPFAHLLLVVALHVHLKVPNVPLPAGCCPLLGLSCQQVHVEPAVVLHAVVPRVHSVRQGAPRVRLPGSLPGKQGWVSGQARRDPARQDTRALLHSGQSSNHRSERSTAPAPGPDRQIYTCTTLLSLEN